MSEKTGRDKKYIPIICDAILKRKSPMELLTTCKLPN